MIIMLCHFIFIETYPLRDVNIINGTESSPPSVQCLFTDDVMIVNNYSTGCLAYYYTNMDQAVYVPRKDYASNATIITDITNSGYYSINVISLPSPGHHMDSVYISVEPSEYV